MKKYSLSTSTVDNPYARSVPGSAASSRSSVTNHMPRVSNAPYVSDHKRVDEYLTYLIEQVGGVFESRGMFGMVYKISATRTRTLHAILVDIIYNRLPRFPHVTDTLITHERVTGDIALKIEHSSQIRTLKNARTGFDLTAYNAERAKWVKEVDIMVDLPQPLVPKVYLAFTAGLIRVTAMEFIEGTPIDQVMRIPPAYGFEMSILKSLEKQVHSLLWMLWKRGYVHMDLHGNNVLVRPNGRIVVIDFGESTRLPKKLRPSGIPLRWNAHRYWKKRLEPEIDRYIQGKHRDTYIPNAKLITVLRKQRQEFEDEEKRLRKKKKNPKMPSGWTSLADIGR